MVLSYDFFYLREISFSFLLFGSGKLSFLVNECHSGLCIEFRQSRYCTSLSRPDKIFYDSLVIM